jgi:Flp pilus assembly protein TadG
MRGPVVNAQRLPATSRRQRDGHHDRGGAAVEMALVLPLLLFVLMALIDFGRAYNAQIQLSAAAREGVRLASLNPGATLTTQKADLNFGDGAIRSRVQNAAGGLSGVTATATYCNLTTPTTASVVAQAPFTWITGISAMSKFFGTSAFPTPTTLQSTGVMRCTG